MKIAVYGNSRQYEYAGRLLDFFVKLKEGGAGIVMHSRLFRSLAREGDAVASVVSRVVDDGQEFTADAALSFGGDGAILRTAIWVGDREIPILGINTGHLGFLASASIEELDTVAEEVLAGNLPTRRRTLLQVHSPALPTWPFALNEVALSKDATASMIEADTRLDGEPLATFRADGLIVSTPTGSTAYNLSAGGPIVEPEAPVWVISPVAAHSLGMRPLTVADSHSVEVSVKSRTGGFRLALDGRSVSLPADTEIIMARAPFCVHLVARPGHDFFSTLRDKLFWSL